MTNTATGAKQKEEDILPGGQASSFLVLEKIPDIF